MKYDTEFREGAVRIVEETRKPIAQVARDLGVNEGTLGNWVNQARAARDGHGELAKDDYEELKRLRVEVAELRMERDVLKRGGFNWSSQHLDRGGVWWRVRGSRGRRFRQVRGGSGRRIGHYGRRCVPRGGRNRLERCSVTSGV